jgi:hypothetical protein
MSQSPHESFSAIGFSGELKEPAHIIAGLSEAVEAVEAAEEWLKVQHEGAYVWILYGTEVHAHLFFLKGQFAIANTKIAKWPVEYAPGEGLNINMEELEAGMEPEQSSVEKVTIYSRLKTKRWRKRIESDKGFQFAVGVIHTNEQGAKEKRLFRATFLLREDSVLVTIILPRGIDISKYGAGYSIELPLDLEALRR